MRLIIILFIVASFYSCKPKTFKLQIQTSSDIAPLLDAEMKNNDKALVAQQYSEIPGDRVPIGRGYNSATFTIKGPVIDRINSDWGSDLNQTGQLMSYDLQHVRSIQELRTSMGLDASASLKMAGFKGSIKHNYLSSRTFNNFSDFLVASIIVRNPTQYFKEPLLNQEALELAGKNKEAFINAYGNEFTYGLITGGELYVIYRFDSKTSQEQKNTRTEITSVLKKFGVKAKSSITLASSLAEMKQTADLHVKILRVGDDTEIPEDNVDSLLQYMRLFPSIISNKGTKSRVILTLTEPITNTKNFPHSKISSDSYLPYIEQSKKIDKIALKLEEINSEIGNLNYILSNEPIFESLAMDTAKDNLSILNSLHIDLDHCAEVCALAINQCTSCDPLLTTKIKRYKPASPVVMAPEITPSPQEIVAIQPISDWQLVKAYPVGEGGHIEMFGSAKWREKSPAKFCRTIIKSVPDVIKYIVEYKQTRMGYEEIVESGYYTGEPIRIRKTGVNLYVRLRMHSPGFPGAEFMRHRSESIGDVKEIVVCTPIVVNILN